MQLRSGWRGPARQDCQKTSSRWYESYSGVSNCLRPWKLRTLQPRGNILRMYQNHHRAIPESYMPMTLLTRLRFLLDDFFPFLVYPAYANTAMRQRPNSLNLDTLSQSPTISSGTTSTAPSTSPILKHTSPGSPPSQIGAAPREMWQQEVRDPTRDWISHRADKNAHEQPVTSSTVALVQVMCESPCHFTKGVSKKFLWSSMWGGHASKQATMP